MNFIILCTAYWIGFDDLAKASMGFDHYKTTMETYGCTMPTEKENVNPESLKSRLQTDLIKLSETVELTRETIETPITPSNKKCHYWFVRTGANSWATKRKCWAGKTP